MSHGQAHCWQPSRFVKTRQGGSGQLSLSIVGHLLGNCWTFRGSKEKSGGGTVGLCVNTMGAGEGAGEGWGASGRFVEPERVKVHWG